MKQKRLVKRVKQLEKQVAHLGNYVSYLVKSDDLTDSRNSEATEPEEQPQETSTELHSTPTS